MPNAPVQQPLVRAQVAGERLIIGPRLQELHLQPEHRNILERVRHGLHLPDHPVVPPPPPPPAPPLPDSIDLATGNISFDGPPVGGWGNIRLYKNGNYEFWGHFHDSGAPSYDAGVAWVIVDNEGTAFTFLSKVHLNGTFEAGSRDGDWNQTGGNETIAQRWPQLCAAYHYRWTANVNWDWGILVKQVEDALKVAGTVIGAVVAVVAMV